MGSGAAAVPAAKPSLASTPQVHDVEIRSFQFAPESIQVRLGDTIQWTNTDLALHTATEFGWDTGSLAQIQAVTITVTEDMETSFFCVFHPHMEWKIEIVR